MSAVNYSPQSSMGHGLSQDFSTQRSFNIIPQLLNLIELWDKNIDIASPRFIDSRYQRNDVVRIGSISKVNNLFGSYIFTSFPQISFFSRDLSIRLLDKNC